MAVLRIWKFGAFFSWLNYKIGNGELAFYNVLMEYWLEQKKDHATSFLAFGMLLAAVLNLVDGFLCRLQ